MLPSGSSARLNGICPYFTMFPLEFPYSVLSGRARPGDWVLDPFCGRGTTLFAARLLGLPALGVDSSPVAAAASEAKLVNVSPDSVVGTARRVLEEVQVPRDVPEGEFWELAYHPEVLRDLCRLREGLLMNCESDERKALRAILLGALHGPRPKHGDSYLSNQSPRTYAPKPGYAVRFWKARGLRPRPVDVIGLIATRADRYYAGCPPRVPGVVAMSDSRDPGVFERLARLGRVRWVVTSPPYYGLRTYLQDQWLRLWLLGGRPSVDYTVRGQLEHRSPDAFTEDLGRVWRNAAAVCMGGARLIVRFGAINDRRVNPLPLIEGSFRDTGWRVWKVCHAASAERGRRQALHFGRGNRRALEELDIWASLDA